MRISYNRSLKQLLLFILCITLGAQVSSASSKERAHKAKASSDLRQVAVAFATYLYSGGRVKDNPEKFQNMEGLLRLLAEKADLWDASVFLNYADADHFEEPIPTAIGERDKSGKFNFHPEILNFPIGFSFAVYPDLKGPTSMTPIIWTRGLHRHEGFDASYGGHVVFLDGHVEYVTGEPGNPEERLLEIFGVDSEYSKVIRISEHIPETWVSKGLEPLPIRIEKYRPPSHEATIRNWIFLFMPAITVAALVALLSKSPIRERAWDALIALGIILILTLVLAPSVC